LKPSTRLGSQTIAECFSAYPHVQEGSALVFHSEKEAESNRYIEIILYCAASRARINLEMHGFGTWLLGALENKADFLHNPMEFRRFTKDIYVRSYEYYVFFNPCVFSRMFRPISTHSIEIQSN
jgi:hypothetical protein